MSKTARIHAMCSPSTPYHSHTSCVPAGVLEMVRAAGAKEVHLRISCPPTVSPCFYGVDTPQRSELIAATHSLEEIRKYLSADSVAYLSLDGLTAGVKGGRSKYCTSCYTGHYPVPVPSDVAARAVAGAVEAAMQERSGVGLLRRAGVPSPAEVVDRVLPRGLRR